MRDLLEQGALKENEGTFSITDPKKGIAVIADIGDEVLEKFYTKEDAVPSDVEAYIDHIRTLRDDDKMQRFIAVLQRGRR